MNCSCKNSDTKVATSGVRVNTMNNHIQFGLIGILFVLLFCNPVENTLYFVHVYFVHIAEIGSLECIGKCAKFKTTIL